MKTFSVNLGQIFGIISIEKDIAGNMDFPQLLFCTNKEKNILALNFENNKPTIIDTGNRVVIEFGCGIGPLL